MTALLIGYARCPTDQQDLTAQHDGLVALGVAANRIYVDHGLTGTNRERPGRREALAACREGDTLVVTKLDWLARSLPDASAIADELTAGQVRLNLGGSVYDPTDPVGRLLFNVLAMVAEFESDLIRLRTKEGMKVAKAKGRLRGKQPKLNRRQEAHLVALLKGGEYSTAELADLFGVARSTVPGTGTGASAGDRGRRQHRWLKVVCCPVWHTLRDSNARFAVGVSFGTAGGSSTGTADDRESMTAHSRCAEARQRRLQGVSVVLSDNEPLGSRTDFLSTVDGPSQQKDPHRGGPHHVVGHLLDGLWSVDTGVRRIAQRVDASSLILWPHSAHQREHLSVRGEIRRPTSSSTRRVTATSWAAMPDVRICRRQVHADDSE
jgi:DNA invertase Pin-like site-specific DNA recombinase